MPDAGPASVQSAAVVPASFVSHRRACTRPSVGQVQCHASPVSVARTSSEQLTGAGVSRYRNRVRVAGVLERIGAGEADLAALASDLGFADQSHLTRTVRAVTGKPPAAWRS
jgi:AraC-like DNA-binding protein